MNSILTINKLGHATIDDRSNMFIRAESDKALLVLQNLEPLYLVQNIISRLETPVKLKIGESYRLTFDPFNVYINWEAGGQQIASFDEVELVKMINIGQVHDLVVSRKAKSS